MFKGSFGKAVRFHLILLMSLFALIACSGGGSGSNATPDTTSPVITLSGSNPVELFQNDSYTEAGASATDNVDGSVNVTITGTVDTSSLGSYIVTYSATDAAGNTGTTTRTVNVVADTTPPVITLNGSNPAELTQNNAYTEAGASATDNRDGNVSVTITGTVNTSSVDGNVTVSISGTVNTSNVGSYIVTYSATDAAGNTDTTTRTVNVISNDFITLWKTDNPGVSNNDQIRIGTAGGGYDYRIDWGDGQTDLNVTGDITHTYATAGTYTVSISGDFPQIVSGSDSDAEKLLSIERWGDIKWRSMNSAFYNCRVLEVNASDAPDLSLVTDMSHMFRDARAFNQDLSTWDVSAVTDMSFMFSSTNVFNSNVSVFNQDLSSWDVSAVTDMSFMFSGAGAFNQDLSTWDVSAVADMESMFSNANAFNQDLSTWDVSTVTNMRRMFLVARAFNQDLSNWDVSAVTNMRSMFTDASAFNQDLSNWEVSGVTNMSNMFRLAIAFNQNLSTWNVSAVTTMNRMFNNARAFNQNLSTWDVSAVTNMEAMFFIANAFNQDLSNWDVSAVTNMGSMFSSASAFNQDLSNWNVSAVTSMNSMFSSAGAFNQDLSNWDVSAVTNMDAMFRNASAFNQDLSTWDVSAVTTMGDMFLGASSFNQNLSNWDVSAVTVMEDMFRAITLSPVNYDALLTSWSTQSLQSNVIFDAGNSQYSSAAQVNRDTLTGVFGWTVTDGGVVP